MAQIEIYTKDWCAYSRAAKALLERRGLTFTEIDASDPARNVEMIQRAHGRRTVPQIFFGDRHIGGYDDLASLAREGRLDAALAGNPEPSDV